MKNIKFKLLSILVLSIIAWSCNKLDIQPANMLSDNQIYNNEAGITAALQTLYMQLPVAGFSSGSDNVVVTSGGSHLNLNMSAKYTGECQLDKVRGSGYTELLGSHYTWWNYTYIRYCNLCIKGLKDNYDLFAANRTKYNHWLGEAYFCRAFEYYTIVKSFGGVPIVKTVDSYLNHSNIAELYIPRNTEKEVVDFIAADLDSAMVLMGPAEVTSGRANKYIAANLKARVMLFAACEAKNGTVQLNGLVGIPVSDSKDYYKKAYAAAQFVIDGGKYSLYRKYDNGTFAGKVLNYQSLFYDKSTANTERMFIERFESGINSTSWEANQRPKGYTIQNDASSELSATMEWVEMNETLMGLQELLTLAIQVTRFVTQMLQICLLKHRLVCTHQYFFRVLQCPALRLLIYMK
jgi:hypothetical protein